MAATTRKPKSRFKVIGRKDGLVDRVVHAIEEQVLTGRLAVGTRLPPEREFSEQLGVSRPVVREAVRILTTRGLLETRHGIGTTVRAISRADIVKPLTLFLRSRGEEVRLQHLHQVRSILEVENAGLAAARIESGRVGICPVGRSLLRVCHREQHKPRLSLGSKRRRGFAVGAGAGQPADAHRRCRCVDLRADHRRLDPRGLLDVGDEDRRVVQHRDLRAAPVTSPTHRDRFRERISALPTE